MPKMLFSRIRFYDIKDLMYEVRRPRRKRYKNDIECVSFWKMNHEPYPTSLSLKPGSKLQPSLEKLLRDKLYSAAFRSFLQTEFSEENLDFWLSCEDFKGSASLDELRDKAQNIYREFLESTAKREVNVDHHIREKIRGSLEKPSVTSFDDAQRHVYLLMEKDSWPRFLQSEIYLSLKNKSRTQWYI